MAKSLKTKELLKGSLCISFLKIFAKVLSILPESLVEKIAEGMAWFVFDVLRVRRKLVLKNLNLALGDVTPKEELLSIGRQSYKNFLVTAFEFFRSKDHPISANFEVKGEEHLKAALDKGEGVYILCFHLGSWEAMGSYITKNIGPAHVLVKKVGGGGMNRFVEEYRNHNEFLWVKRQKKGDGFKAIVDILDKGEMIGFVMDQARPGEPRLPFFGHPAKTNTSFAAIWQKDGKRRSFPAMFIVKPLASTFLSFSQRCSCLSLTILSRMCWITLFYSIRKWKKRCGSILSTTFGFTIVGSLRLDYKIKKRASSSGEALFL